MYSYKARMKAVMFYIKHGYRVSYTLRVLGTHKSQVAKTKVNDLMLKDNMGKASQQLLCQFLYRRAHLKKCKIP